ncbi:MAG: right-handed parallel beta-helix repeat-containing protein [Candidatus Bathyarchaeia archaeon]
MKDKIAVGMLLTLFLASMLTLAFNIQPAKGWTGTVYIRVDGRVDPSTAPIERIGNVYNFMDNITNWRIVVERDNIVINGTSHVLDGKDLGGGAGINLTGRSQVTIKNLEIRNFGWGIYLSNSSNNTISGNIVREGAFGIFLNSSSNYNSILENTIETNDDHAIELNFSSNNTIARNNVTNHGFNGILLRYNSSYNNIYENNLVDNKYGIQLNHFCLNNTIARNNITGSDYAVILYYSSDYNSVYENNIYYNGKGISLSQSLNNLIYHNNFINNTQQAYISMLNYTNIWDNGYPSGGNYWSDYTGMDANGDGIGDTPYIINQDNVDRYPLMYPYGTQTYKLTITTTDGGTTTPSLGMHTYANGTIIEVTAIQDVGFSFDYWLLDGEIRIENPITIIMDANYTLEAHFVDDMPPEISDPWQDPPPDNVQPLQNVTVWVNVTELGSGIKNVTLWFSLDNGTTWTALNMTALPIPSDTTITYEATIPGYEYCTWVSYKIVAYDNAGTNATKDNLGYYYKYHVIPEFPSAIIMPLFLTSILLIAIFSKGKQKPKPKTPPFF